MTIDLDAIKARAEAATAGPWNRKATLINSRGHGVICAISELRPQGRLVRHVPLGLGSVDWDEAMANAAFILHARTDVPALVAEVERLREALAEVRDEAWSNRDCAVLGDGSKEAHQMERKLGRIAGLAAKALDGSEE